MTSTPRPARPQKKRLQPAKTVEESELFAKSKAAIQVSARLFDESVLFSVSWAVATDSAKFPLVDSDNGIRLIKTEALDDQIPPLVFYFKEDKERVILLDVKVDPTV